MNNSSDFYDNISGFYDEMINFEAALENRKKVIKNLVKPGMQKACDLGCGTGLDSISLALACLDVFAFDISKGMIDTAEKNSLRSVVNVNFALSPIHKIPKEYHNKFDIAVSLGNTLANIEPKMLALSLKKINKILKPNCRLILQLLNYELIRKTNQRIVKISKGNNETIIRFYDIMPDKFNFNILKFNNANLSIYELNTSVVYPYNRCSVKIMLNKAGFRKIRFYGNLNLDDFDKENSGDLVAIAFK